MVRVLVFFCLLIPIFFISCEIINPPEQIPSYITVDTVRVKINSPAEGTSIHNISDCWLYVNNKLIGVFEVPFKVPVLESGVHSIQIEPGIKNSGGDANRDIYPMMYGYYITDTLTEGEVLNIVPEFSYRPVVFDLIEDFEDIGIAFQVSSESDTTISLVSGNEAQEGKSMYVALDDEHPNFECRSTSLYEIEKNGSAFLEVSFKCTDSIDFGLFALESNGASMSEIRKSVFTFKPTNTWKKVYIDLHYHVINTTGTQFRLYFAAIRSEDDETDKTEFYFDNIKLIYISTR
ncbi:MAG TPA: hypothetical protein PLL66_03095 [Bacteroidales bacterium]|nr:hypothetical protein [Bacteroidales bacterium]